MSGLKRQAVTIHDVAKHAGVSSMTASRVVNGYAHVSAKARDKVMSAVVALGYKQNKLARATRSGVVQIGMLYSNPSSSNLSEYLMGAFRQANSSGCQLLIEPTATHPTGREAVEKLVSTGVGAVVLPPPLCDDAEILGFLEDSGVAAVSFSAASARPGGAAVYVDDVEGARIMTRHLLALGHRRIAFVRGDQSHSTALRREEGFRAAMAEAGVPVCEDFLVDGHFTYRGGLEAARALLARQDPPTAIFASNDDMAAAVSAVAHGLGLSLPGQLSIAGFDDTSVASTIWPQLTTIRQPIADMAATAVRIAEGLLRGEPEGEDGRRFEAPLTLVERDSTAAPLSRAQAL